MIKKLWIKLLTWLGFYKETVSLNDLRKPDPHDPFIVKKKYREILRKRGVKDWKYEEDHVIAINQENAVRKINNKRTLEGRTGLLKGVWRKMTIEEKEEYANKTFGGPVLYQDGEPMVMMGSKAYKRLVDFEDKMNDKYTDDQRENT